MPPNGGRLLEGPGLQAVAGTLDRVRRDDRAGRAVAGASAAASTASSYDRNHKECGRFPTGIVVVTLARQAPEKPQFSRIYRPADLYLNGECADDGGYYIEAGQSRCLCSVVALVSAAAARDRAVPEPPADAAGRIHLRHRGAGGRSRPAISTSSTFSGRARSARLPPAARLGAVRRAARRQRRQRDPVRRVGRMFVADYKKHNVFVFEPGAAEPRSIFTPIEFNQPNDLTLARGRHALCERSALEGAATARSGASRAAPTATVVGEMMTSAADDEHHQRHRPQPRRQGRSMSANPRRSEIWAYRLDGATLAAPRLVKKFTDASIDGLRTDIDGRIYVARILKGTIAGAAARRRRRARNSAARRRSRPTWRSAGRTAKPCSSPSARAASSKPSASTDRAASSACRRVA